MSRRLELRSSRVGVLLNTSGGSFNPSVPDALRGLLKTAGLEPSEVWTVPGREVDAALDAAMRLKIETLIVFGGDGTLRAAAERCDASGPLLLPLPGGTMNVLPRALYGSRNWRAALSDTLKAPRLQVVQGAEVGGHRFYVAGAFGGVSLLAGAREAVRDGDLTAALDHGRTALTQALAREVDYRFEDGPAAKAEAIVVLCPLSPASADQAPLLEAAAIDVEGVGDAIRLAVMSAFRGWRSDPTVTRAHVRRLEIVSTEPIPAILDGERFMLDRSTTVALVPQAFTALTPDVEPGQG
jgi:diacylglycerol kinase family enzyme